MIVRDLVCAAVRSGYFNKDLMAIRHGPKADGFAYLGKPESPGFSQIIQPGEAVSVMLVLEDGQIAFGDCVDVILAGIAGRDAVFRVAEHLPVLRTTIRDVLRGRRIDRFRPLAEEIEQYQHSGRRLHTAVRYGLSQALLHAAALANRATMAEVIVSEYRLPHADEACAYAGLVPYARLQPNRPDDPEAAGASAACIVSYCRA